MGHADDNTFQAYISQVSEVDLQNLMSGKPQREQLFDSLRSMAMGLDVTPKAPIWALLSQSKRSIERVSQASTFPAELRDSYTLCPAGGEMGSGDCPTNLTIPSRPLFREFEHCLEYEPERKAVIDAFEKPSAQCTSLEHALTALLVLAQPLQKYMFYPGLQMTDERKCPACNTLLKQ